MKKQQQPTKNLSKLDIPSFLLNIPTSISSKEPNNIWMKEMMDAGEDIEINKESALSEWMELYSFLSANGMVTVLPTPHDCELQDLAYVANLGVVINPDTIVVSNFTSEPRKGETEVGLNYFKVAGYKNVIVSPYKFEGEADLKHIKDNLWIGGYGMRTDIRTFEWMEKEFGIEIIKVKMTNEKMYHFDCVLFPLTQNAVMLCKEVCSKEEIAQIKAKGIDVIDVPMKFAEMGITNNVRCHHFIINSSDLSDLDPTDPEEREFYKMERDKNQFLEDICLEYSLEPVFMNLGTFILSGAMTSCLVMHLNRFSYSIDMI